MKGTSEFQQLISVDLSWRAKAAYARARWSVSRWAKAASPHKCGHIIKFRSGEEAVLRLGTTDVLVFREIFLENIYRSALAAMPGAGRNLRVMDCGANIGLFSVLCARYFDYPSLLCVEPSAGNLKSLNINVANLRANVTAVHAFVGYPNGDGYLRDTGDGEWGFALSRTPIEEISSVPILDIPSLIRRAGWDGIDLLKMDIEGAEDEVFANSESWIDLVNSMIVELHSGYSMDRFVSDISQTGRRWRIDHHLTYGDQILCSARRVQR
jgi:FkbM family methyltransferase